MGVYSQLLTVNNFVFFIVSMGLPIGIVKYISQWSEEKKENDIYSLLYQLLIFGAIMSGIASLVFIVLSHQISALLFETSDFNFLIIIVSSTFSFSVASSLLDSYLKGLKVFSKYVKISVITVISTTLIAIGAVYFYGELGAAIGLAATSVVSFFFMLVYLFKNKFLKLITLERLKKIDYDIIKNILKLGVASLFLGSLDQLTYTFLKVFIVRELGIEQNGIYQCAYSISNNYINVFFLTMSIYYLPVLSGLKEQGAINLEINSVFRFTILLIFPVITVSYVYREYLIMIFFSNEFLPAGDILLYIFMGDFLKAVTWVLGMWLIANLKIKIWVMIDIIYFTSFGVLFYFLMTNVKIGLLSASISYFAACIIKFLLDFLYLRNKNNFKLEGKNIKLLVSSAAFIAAIFYLSVVFTAISFYIVFPILILFYIINIDKDEFTGFKKIIADKLKK